MCNYYNVLHHLSSSDLLRIFHFVFSNHLIDRYLRKSDSDISDTGDSSDNSDDSDTSDGTDTSDNSDSSDSSDNSDNSDTGYSSDG